MQYNAIQRDTTHYNSRQCNVMSCHAKWNGMERNGMEWTRDGCSRVVLIVRSFGLVISRPRAIVRSAIPRHDDSAAAAAARRVRRIDPSLSPPRPTTPSGGASRLSLRDPSARHNHSRGRRRRRARRRDHVAPRPSLKTLSCVYVNAVAPYRRIARSNAPVASSRRPAAPSVRRSTRRAARVIQPPPWRLPSELPHGRAARAVRVRVPSSLARGAGGRRTTTVTVLGGRGGGGPPSTHSLLRRRATDARHARTSFLDLRRQVRALAHAAARVRAARRRPARLVRGPTRYLSRGQCVVT